MGRSFLSLLVLTAVLAAPAAAQQKANDLFGAKRVASAQPPAAIGSYAKGCAAGLVRLPETGPGWQAMRLSRNRNWAHPAMVDFIERLARRAQGQGWAGLYVGDISQPRGGPMTSGHASHQIGLDADIWMRPPDRLNLTRAEREEISSINVRSADRTSVNGNFTRAHYNILKAAASDPAVDRIFVTPPVKVVMCKTARPADTPWLQKIRPYYGHNTHFHVRLKCPSGSPDCKTQQPTVAELSNGGNGCDETLEWWITDYLNPPEPTEPDKPKPKRRGARDYTMKDLPRQCAQVLASR